MWNRVRTLRPIDKYMIKDVPRYFRGADTEPIELDHVSLGSGGLEVETFGAMANIRRNCARCGCLSRCRRPQVCDIVRKVRLFTSTG